MSTLTITAPTAPTIQSLLCTPAGELLFTAPEEMREGAETMPLRILDYPWHQAHAYRLHALPAEFWFLTSYHTHRKVLWDESQRPIPPNFMGGIDSDEISPDRFDLALLHLDQWCDDSVRVPYRALPFRRVNVLARDIPRIVIMHGTPDSSLNRRRILQMIGDLPVVCNSFQAAQEWDGDEGRLDRYGLPQFRAIIHGYNVDEFWSAPLAGREIEIATVCSGGTISRQYHGLPLLERLVRDVPLAWYGPTGNRKWMSNYAAYREMLARTLVYFSPTRRAPMPGARSEAMLSGCCVVTVPGNDAEIFVEHGWTGYVVESYVEARDTLRGLLADTKRAYRVGQAGREIARAAFGRERYVAEWMNVLGEIGVGQGARGGGRLGLTTGGGFVVS